jgi:hypothetical protein
MVEPARPAPLAEDAPPGDPSAVVRAYHLHRARRRARLEHTRSARRASVRFWAFLLVLLGLAVFLAVTVWHAIHRLFGL